MNKLLIGIKSCQRDRDRGDHDVIRNTWGKNLSNKELLFFIGNHSGVYVANNWDEAIVPAPDDYDSLTLKTIEICRWALNEGYDYAFLCDTDTYVRPDLLMKTGFENFDYSGAIIQKGLELGKSFKYTARTRGGKDYLVDPCYPWASGGLGFFLSQKAMEVLISVPPPTEPVLIWCEDLWVGRQLQPLYPEMKIGHLDNLAGKSTWHFPQGRFNSRYDPKFGWQEQMQKNQGVF